MSQNRNHKFLQLALAAIAILFGLMTLVAGTRVLTGADPGYTVFFPLLVYNTVMGPVYILAGLIAWQSLDKGRFAAGAIFVLNLFVLAGLVPLTRLGYIIATQSLRAMTLRTVVWLVIFLGLAWLRRPPRAVDS